MSEFACLLAVQQQRLTVQIMLEGEGGSVPQVKIWVLNQLRAKHASEVEHLIYLRPRLDRARPFNAHVVDGLAGADAQAVDEVTGYQDTL